MTLIAQISLSGFVLGQTANQNISGAGSTATPYQQLTQEVARLGLYNESGVGLVITFQPSKRQFIVPAGAWLAQLPLLDGESSFDYSVVYTLPNPPVSILFVDLALPPETAYTPPILGNSPIGLSGQVAAVVTQVQNDGNPAVLKFIEATPSTGPNAGISSVGINNDGSGYLSGDKIQFDNAGTLTVQGAIEFNNGGYIHQDTVNHFTEQKSAGSGAAAGHLFSTWDGAAGHQPLSLGTTGITGRTIMADDGSFAQVASQASAGSFGVPVIVAQSIRQHVTTVGSYVTNLSYTPTVTGLYRVSGYVVMQDTAARALGWNFAWTDPDTSSAYSEWLVSSGGASGFVIQAFNLSNSWNNNVGFGAFSAPFMAKASNAIVVQYQHPAGTANDFVTVMIERLA